MPSHRNDVLREGFVREAGLSMAQSNGDGPGIGRSAHAPGDHGISFVQMDLPHGIEASGTSAHHLLSITTASEGLLTTGVEGRFETFSPTAGTVAIVPEGAACLARGAGAMAAFNMLVPRETLAFAAAERGRPGASVVARLSGEDAELLRLGGLLAEQVAEDFVDDPLAWYELSEAVVQRLVDAHLSAPPPPARGALDPKTTARVIELIHDRADRPIGVDDIAEAAQQTWSHFPRLFRRAVGLSPYQYVVKVRLDRALALLRSTRMSVADVAVRVGFCDQSHLCRWVRRMYGTTPLAIANGAAR